MNYDCAVGKWYICVDGVRHYLSCGQKVNYYVGEDSWFLGRIEFKDNYGGYVVIGDFDGKEGRPLPLKAVKDIKLI